MILCTRRQSIVVYEKKKTISCYLKSFEPKDFHPLPTHTPYHWKKNSDCTNKYPVLDKRKN